SRRDDGPTRYGGNRSSQPSRALWGLFARASGAFDERVPTVVWRGVPVLAETAARGESGGNDPANGQARPLRTWQRRALTHYLASRPQDFLAVATPGSGKTVFALRVAIELLSDRTAAAVTIVTPTEHLKHQWAEAAAAAGVAIDPDLRNTTGVTSSDYDGVAVTYAQVAAHPNLHRVRTENRKTLVILDEIHHGGDAKSWGDAI